jgi:hypothetical protein
MKDKDRESYKKAYREFQVAISFKPNDLKIEKLLNDAYDAALTRVVITEANDLSYRYSSYHYGAQQNTTDEMIRNLGYNSGNEFVKFYSVPEARSQGIQPDEVVEVRMNNINLGRMQENCFSKEVTKDVVVKQIVYKPDSVVNVYAKVNARINTTQRTLYSDGNLSITIRDEAGNLLWNDNVNGQSSWSTQFSSYTGDERALSEEDKHLINRRPDNIPGDAGIIDCVRKDILNNTFNRIRDYYSRY